MAAFLAVLPAIVGLLVALIELWNAKAPERAKEETNEAIQQGRQDIADGDADSVAVRIDSVLSVQGTSSSDPSGVQSAEDIERRISQL